MKWCEIFRTGEHRDSNGNTKLWIDDDLKRIYDNFKTKNPDVPICVGHPKSNSPAFGWVDDLKIENGRLFASYKNVQNEFKEAVKRGILKTRSISLTPDLMLRHIAFLGGQTPAIKGLEQFCFQEEIENEIHIDFQDEVEPAEGLNGGENFAPSITQNQSQVMIEKSEASAEEPEGEEGVSSPPPQEKEEKGVKMNEEDFNKQLAEKDETISALQKQLEEKNKTERAKEFEDFCTGAIEKGQILPVQKTAVMNILSAVADNSPFEFEDGSEKTPVELIKDFVSDLKQMNFEEVATPKNVEEKQNNIDFSDAESIKNGIIEIQNEYKKKGIALSSQEALNKLRGEQ